MKTIKGKAKVKKVAAKKAPVEPSIVSFKGFDKNWQCRGFQYAIGQSYEHKGEVEACSSGFHSCENPLDVFGYYAPGDSKFAIVEASGKIARDGGDTKIASASINIKAEIFIPEIVTKAIAWVTSLCTSATAQHATGDRSASSATGDQSASSATGYQSASSATGDRSASSATGDQSASSATGDRSASSATGYRSASSATGDQSASSATGDRSASSATGYQSASSATGYRSASSATGYRSASSATGYRSASSATGYRSASSATGDRSASSATGDRSASSATGDRSASSATGYRSASSATGDQSASSATGDQSASLTIGNFGASEVLKISSQSVAIGVGYQNKAKAAEGCAIVLCYRDDKYNIVHIRASKVGENGIEADKWYSLNECGEFVRV